MNILIELAEKEILPDLLIRMGIRRLNRKRLKGESHRDIEGQRFAMQRFIEDMKEAPIAISTDKANIQHYELPSTFFSKVLGKHMKYSGNFWKPGVDSLDQAETDQGGACGRYRPPWQASDSSRRAEEAHHERPRRKRPGSAGQVTAPP